MDRYNHIYDPAGSLGGVGFREDAHHVVFTATDIWSGYAPGGAEIINGVPIAEFIGDESGSWTGGRPYSPSGVTVEGSIAALDSLDVSVVGFGRGSTPETMLKAIAKATGAVASADITYEDFWGEEVVLIHAGDPLYLDLDTYSDEILAQCMAQIIISTIEIPSVTGNLDVNTYGDLNGNGIMDGQEEFFNSPHLVLCVEDCPEPIGSIEAEYFNGVNSHGFTNFSSSKFYELI